MHAISPGISLILLASLISPWGSASFRGHDPGIAQPSSQEKPPPPLIEKRKPDPQEKDEAIRISSKLVLVPVSASDVEGRPVKDLKVEEIVIEEEGRPQQVVALGEPGKSPVDIALLFDVSGSTHGQFAFQQQVAVQFIKEVLKPGDGVSLFSVGITPRQVRVRTTSGEEAIQGILGIQSSKEPTAFFDSIVEATRYIEKTADPASRRVLVIISDGEENFSVRNDLDDALRELQKSDCLFYAINPSGGGIRLNTISLKGQSILEAMAAQTGGKAFNLAKLQELEYVFRLIAEELQAQYLFGYYSADDRADGGFRRITVRSKRPNLRIRARQGYYVPKAGEDTK